MQSDRELLRLAAKAAGYWDAKFNCAADLPSICWNPLTDDGDALRLAAKLMMSVEISEHEASTYAYAGPVDRVYAMELWRNDRYTATRRAITRAAAALAQAAQDQASVATQAKEQ